MNILKLWGKIIVACIPAIVIALLKLDEKITEQKMMNTRTINDLAKEEYIRKIVIISGRSLIQMSGYARNTKILSNYVDTLYYRMRGIKAITWHTVLSTLKDVDGGVEYVRREKVSDN